MNAPTIPTTKAVTAKRMSLSAVKSGRIEQPLRVLVYGPEGIGKTTFGSNAPEAIFLCSEDGTSQFDVRRFETPETWAHVLEAVDELTTADHQYQTLVFDTLDWLEPILWRHVCEFYRGPKGEKFTTIEGFGWGKGYTEAVTEWRALIAKLEKLRRVKRMNIVLLAHAHVRPYQNPTGDNYDRFTLKINEKAAGLWREWVDDLLFTNYETFTRKDKDATRAKGVSNGARVMHSERRAAFDAKNRNGLPETMALDWHEYANAVANRGHDVEALRASIAPLLSQIPDQARRESATAKFNGTEGQDSAWLRNALNLINTMIEPKEEVTT
jgi:AAA domain